MRPLFSIALVVILFPANIHGATDEVLNYGRFGAVTLYRTAPHPSHVVLFVSGDGGWNKGVVDMARELSSLDAISSKQKRMSQDRG